jgi:hypothetical protein
VVSIKIFARLPTRARWAAASGAALVFKIGGLAALCGTVLLAAGLWRARAVPAWTAIAVAAATVANIAGLSAASVPVTMASYVLLLAAFSRIAVIVSSSPAWDLPGSPVTAGSAGTVQPARNAG